VPSAKPASGARCGLCHSPFRFRVVPMPSLRESGVRGLSSTRRVLIVDDQEDVAELTAMLLAEHGHDVRIAFDGESARALAAEFKPQVALLDIGLPTMSGHELAARLLATPNVSECRLIAVSGHGDERDLELSHGVGFARHLTKPVSIEYLLRAIADCDRGDRASNA
jgi:DNA-binding response OmpR family regulator